MLSCVDALLYRSREWITGYPAGPSHSRCPHPAGIKAPGMPQHSFVIVKHVQSYVKADSAGSATCLAVCHCDFYFMVVLSRTPTCI